MIEFIFDNIAIVGFVLYALIIFVSKIFTATDSQADEKQSPPVKTPRHKPVVNKPTQAYQTPQKDVQVFKFPEEEPYFEGTKIEPIEDIEDDFFGTEYDVDSPRKMVEQMTANSHIFYGGNSYTPDESILRGEQEIENPEKIAEPAKSQNEFDDILKDTNSLRKAFVASEILGKPKAMQ